MTDRGEAWLHNLFLVLTFWIWIPLSAVIVVSSTVDVVSFWLLGQLRRLRYSLIGRYVKWRPKRVSNSTYIFPEKAQHRPDKFFSGGFCEPEGEKWTVGGQFDGDRRGLVRINIGGSSKGTSTSTFKWDGEALVNEEAASVSRVNAIATEGAAELPMPRGLR